MSSNIAFVSGSGSQISDSSQDISDASSIPQTIGAELLPSQFVPPLMSASGVPSSPPAGGGGGAATDAAPLMLNGSGIATSGHHHHHSHRHEKSLSPTRGPESSLLASSTHMGSTGATSAGVVSSRRRIEELQELVLERELRRIELEEKKLTVETEKLQLEKENLELERQKLQLEIVGATTAIQGIPPSTAVRPVVVAAVQVKPAPVARHAPNTPTLLSAAEVGSQQRRSSSRQIKRKKFDDELVESNIPTPKSTQPKLVPHHRGSGGRASTSGVSVGAATSKQQQAVLSPSLHHQQLPFPVASSSSSSLSKQSASSGKTPVVSTVSSGSATAVVSDDTSSPASHHFDTDDLSSANVATVAASTSGQESPLGIQDRRRSGSVRLRGRVGSTVAGNRRRHINQIDAGKWRPIDDFMLISAALQTCDLNLVHKAVKFSSYFTLRDIQERFNALLYDPKLAKCSISLAKVAHPELVNATNTSAFFYVDEEDLLKAIPSASKPTREDFQKLLDANPQIFAPTRTAVALEKHWMRLREYSLLDDQNVPVLPVNMPEDRVLTFPEMEATFDTYELRRPRDTMLDHERYVRDRASRREILRLEGEVPKLTSMLQLVTGDGIPHEFDNLTYAILSGRRVKFLMRTREITLGRCTKDCTVDVNLSREGPALKVSRRQGRIKLVRSGEFELINEGRPPFVVDARPVLTDTKCLLTNNSVIEICGLRFSFLVNRDLVAVLHEREGAREFNLTAVSSTSQPSLGRPSSQQNPQRR